MAEETTKYQPQVSTGLEFFTVFHITGRILGADALFHVKTEINQLSLQHAPFLERSSVYGKRCMRGSGYLRADGPGRLVMPESGAE